MKQNSNNIPMDPSDLNSKSTEVKLPVSQSVDELSMLFDMSMRLNSILSLNKVLDFIVTRTKEVLKAQNVSVMMFDDEKEQLEIVASTDSTEEAVTKCKFTPGEGLAGRSFQIGQVIISADTSKDKNFVSFSSREPTMLAVIPIRFRERKIGVLNIDRDLNSKKFTETDIQFLTIIANQAGIAIRNSRLFHDLEEKLRSFSVAQRIGNILVSTYDIDTVLQLIVDSLKEITGAEHCSLMLLDGSGRYLTIKAANGLPEDIVNNTSVEVGEGLVGWVASEGCPLLIKDIEKDPRFKRKNRSRYNSNSLLSVPLKNRGVVIGVLNVNNKEAGKEFTYQDQNLLTMFANQAAIAIANARLYQRLEVMALTDGVTGIYNHRAFQERLEKEIARASRFNEQISLMIIDVDHFKRINDSYGHMTGDSVLKEISMFLIQKVRRMDFVARYGGEEFAIILPSASKQEAVNSAERIRIGLQSLSLVDENNDEVITVSIGVSTYNEDGESASQLISCADTAMYAAKKLGRNIVTGFDKNTMHLNNRTEHD